jgi:hypothetical protein
VVFWSIRAKVSSNRFELTLEQNPKLKKKINSSCEMKRNFKNSKPFSHGGIGTPSFWGNGAGEWVMVKDKIIAEFKQLLGLRKPRGRSPRCFECRGNPYSGGSHN